MVDQAVTRGVTPVIGVILLIAITVILVAVIGGFVLGLGGDQEQTPQAAFEVDAAASEENFDRFTVTGLVELRKTGGDELAVDELTLVIENTTNGRTDRVDISSDPPFEGVGVDTVRTADTIRIRYPAVTSLAIFVTGGDEPQTEFANIQNMNEGTEYRVTLIHEPTDGQIVDRTVTA